MSIITLDSTKSISINMLKEVVTQVEEVMRGLLPEQEVYRDCLIAEIMHYSVFTPGKRLRPFLVVCAADLFEVDRYCSLNTAAAIEFIHTYSLIHDDLPCMDDDDIRRDRPSCHKKYGEAEAILAGDALQTLAFEVLASSNAHPDSAVRCELITAIARASGVSGMIGGQMLDIMSETQLLSLNEIIRMQRMKTGELFAGACEAGAILGKAPKKLRTAIKGYAHALGLAFQITDDVMDNTQDAAKISKKNGNKNHARSFVSLVGVEQSKKQAELLIDQAISYLNVFDKKADILKDFAYYILKRNT